MNRDDRLLDLLAARATEGLSSEESGELERLLAERPDVDADQIELAAALADLAFRQREQDPEPMPAELKRRVTVDAERWIGARSDAGTSRSTRGVVVPLPAREGRVSGWWSVRNPAWYLAAAALVIALWAPWSTPPPSAPSPTPAERRARLLATEPDAIQVAWAPPEIPDYAGVRGDVVWSNRLQTGFMRLRGLPGNRPAEAQYQLWIVDPSRDSHPIDGGVFDVPGGADEVVVPIDAKLPVREPKAFAITLEQPGGVVVSDGPLLVVAAVES